MSEEVSAPLFDRLIDREPGVRRELRPFRTLDRAGLRESVRRELEQLFSTRCPLPADQLVGRQRTVVEYGLPDLTVLGPERYLDRERLASVLREAVEAYEPRLGQVRVAVAEPREGEREVLRARIDGVLIIDGVPESVAFDTALHGGAAGVDLADRDEA